MNGEHPSPLSLADLRRGMHAKGDEGYMQQTNLGSLDAQLYGARLGGERHGAELTLLIRLVRALYRAKYVIFLGMVIGIGVGAYMMRLADEVYSSTALVMIDTRVRPEGDLSQGIALLPTSLTAIESELEVLRSRDLLARVVEQLDLAEDPEFADVLSDSNVEEDPSTIDIIANTTKDLVLGLGSFVLPPAPVDQPMPEQELLIDEVSSHLTIEHIGSMSSVFAIRFESTDRMKAARIANAIADEYVASQTEVTFALLDQVVSWLEGRAEQLNTRLLKLEKELVAPTLDPPYKSESLVESDRRKRASLEESLGAARAGGNAELVRSITEDLAEVQMRLRHQGDYEVEVRRLENEIEVARTSYADIASQLDLQPQDLLLGSGVRIIAHARPALEPSWPSRTLALAAGGTLGIFITSLLVGMRELFHDRMRTVKDFEEITGLPVLGLTPAISGRAIRLRRLLRSGPDNRGIIARSVRKLRACIAAVEGPRKFIATVSALPREGKTTTLFLLARSYASSGEKVLVIGCDQSKDFGLCETGLASYKELLAQPELVDRQLFGAEPNIEILTAKPKDDGDGDVLISAEFVKFVKSFAKRYDRILVDTPALLPALDLASVAKVADVVLFVVHWNVTPISAVRTALRLLSDLGLIPSGVVATQVSERRARAYAQDLFAYARSTYPGY